MNDRQYPNPTIELLCERASCRSWTDDNVPEEVLQTILEAGTHAATAGNSQPYSIIVVRKQATKQIIAEGCGQPFVAKAPVILVFCIDWHRNKRWAQLKVAPFNAPSVAVNFWNGFHDTVICTQTVATAADAMGLGSVYLGAPMPAYDKLKARCKLPDHLMPLSMLCLGYPKIRPRPRRKLGIEIVVHTEQYQELNDEALIDAFDDKYHNQERHQITEERLNRIADVCRNVHGEEFANKCLEWITDHGYINHAQHLFGNQYRAHIHAANNPKFFAYMEACGFDWFKI